MISPLSHPDMKDTETFGAVVIPQLNSAGHVDMAKQVIPHAAVQMGQSSWV